MLSLIFKVANYLAKPVENQPNAQVNTHVDLSEAVEVKRLSTIGKITSVHDGYGIVDNSIYFDTDLLQGTVMAKEGLNVHVTAKSSSIAEGWVAESAQILNENWEDGSTVGTTDGTDSFLEQTTIGRITEINRDLCYINEDLCVKLSDTNTIDFTPIVGDWVVATKSDTVNKNDSAASCDSNMYDMKPLRSREFQGAVTSTRGDWGIIDNHIYFHKDICGKGHYWKVGDIIRGTAIESTYDKCEWRVTKISSCLTMEQQRFLKHGQQKVNLLSTLLQDKNNLTVTSPLDLGTLIIGECKSIIVHISNDGNVDVILKHWGFEKSSQNQLECQGTWLQNEICEPVDTSYKASMLRIPADGVGCVNIVCKSRFLGKFKELLTLDFGDFQIGRHVFFSVRDVDHHLLKERKIIQPGSSLSISKIPKENIEKISQQSQIHWVIPGQNFNSHRIKLPVHLPSFKVPNELLECVAGERDLLNTLPILTHTLNMHNYQEKLSALLFLEEIQRQEDMTQFDMYRVCLREFAEYLVLEVPGLSEGRPSLIVGDRAILEDPDELQEPKYQGIVHSVRGNDILLKFNEDFHNKYSGKDYNVTFPYSRTSMRRCHQALSLYRRVGSNILFPTVNNSKLGAIQHHFNPNSLNNKLLNDRQCRAIRGILEARRRPAPYIIYGPPGTGKTVTLVEAVIQVHLARSDSRILICTPSNSAGDVVCERLHLSGLFTPTDMIRWNAFHRLPEDLPLSIRKYCTAVPCDRLVSRYSIIVTTCVMSGMLYNLGIKPGHFTHVFIDEVGQATEPEALVPICLAAAQGIEDFQIILAGDPMQLGPVLRSKSAALHGLDISFLERICQTQPYLRDESKPGNYDPHYVTKLINNYRSHPALIALPSEVFYHAELVPKASTDIALSLSDWIHLPNSSFPIVFHGIRGEDLQEGDSPSWFNSEEAFQVCRYLQSLYCDAGLNPEDIGIITPYRKQVEKILLLIKSLGTVPPKVGSIEEFQGQERRAIILSTVRSSDDWLNFDHLHNLGFLANAKRFNVALTRAQALLVIVGNPFVLIKDFYWRTLVRFCINNGVYRGCDESDLIDLLANTEDMITDANHKSPKIQNVDVNEVAKVKDSKECIPNINKVYETFRQTSKRKSEEINLMKEKQKLQVELLQLEKI